MLKTATHPARNCSDHCAAGSIEKNDAMRIWLELKQNRFLSPSSASMPMSKPKLKPKPAPMPNKKRERHINDGFSEKPELAKVRRVDGLAKVAASASGLLKKFNSGTTTSSVGMLPKPKKHSEMRRIGAPRGLLKVLKVEPTNMYSQIAPPCGLLNEFNPGIINRIRSSKQVFSVIQALVRRDTIGNVDIPSRQEKRFGENDANECPNSSSGSDKLGLCSKAPSGNLCVKTEYEEEVGDLGIAVRTADNDDDKDEVRSSLSSITASEIASSSVLSEASPSIASDSSLSLEDANAASQWLQCLRHDITRRLEDALKKIQNVIRIELPALMLKEFSVDQETEFFAVRRSVCMNVDVHKAKWGNQFDRIDKALNEEASQLVETLCSHRTMKSFVVSIGVRDIKIRAYKLTPLQEFANTMEPLKSIVHSYILVFFCLDGHWVVLLSWLLSFAWNACFPLRGEPSLKQTFFWILEYFVLQYRQIVSVRFSNQEEHSKCNCHAIIAHGHAIIAHQFV